MCVPHASLVYLVGPPFLSHTRLPAGLPAGFSVDGVVFHPLSRRGIGEVVKLRVGELE